MSDDSRDIRNIDDAADAITQGTADQQRPLLLSLFSGAGGLDLGFWQSGYQIALAADIFPAAVATHKRNHGSHGTITKQLDLSQISYKELSNLWFQQTETPPVGIIGGPPCQAFSVSNVYQRDDDPRRIMLHHYAQFVEGFNRDHAIDFFLLENVPGLLDEKHKDSYNQFKDLCDQAGFSISERVINALYFGVPQNRERLILVGINKQKFPDLVFDIPKGDALEPLPIDAVLLGLPDPIFNQKSISPENIPYHPNHWTFNVKSSKFTNGAIQPGKALGRSFRALKWGEPSWTVAYGHREVHIHPDCKRRLSIYEAMLLQGFPHNYVLESNISDQVILVSDAVPPPVAKKIAATIGTALNHNL